MIGVRKRYNMTSTVYKAVDRVEWRRAKVSGKRQVTIPQKLFEAAGITNEVEFGLRGNHIIIRPVRDKAASDQFADLILADLIKKGYSGEELLQAFREQQVDILLAAKGLVAEARETARNTKGTGDKLMNEIFGDVMGE